MTERIAARDFRRLGTGKRAKYGNRKTRGYASKREADRAAELELLARSGAIKYLRSQVPFSLAVNRIHVAKYLADFVYERNGVEIVEDVKGVRTEVYRIKRALMLACHGIEIQEI